MLPHHWQAHTRDYSFACCFTRPCSSLPALWGSLFVQQNCSTGLYQIGRPLWFWVHRNDGYPKRTLQPPSMRSVFRSILSGAFYGGPGSLVSAFIYSEFIQKGTNILWCYCVHQLCGEQFVFSTHVSSLMFRPSSILRCGYFVLARFRIHVSVNHVGNLLVADVELVFLKKAVGLL
jgi:hypothetical protein